MHTISRPSRALAGTTVPFNEQRRSTLRDIALTAMVTTVPPSRGPEAGLIETECTGDKYVYCTAAECCIALSPTRTKLRPSAAIMSPSSILTLSMACSLWAGDSAPVRAPNPTRHAACGAQASIRTPSMTTCSS